MISITCPSCSHRFDAPAEDVGQEAKCSNCGESFILAVPPLLPPPGEPELVLYPVAEPIAIRWNPFKIAAWVVLGWLALGTIVMIVLGCLALVS